MDKRNQRVLWLINHKTLMEFEPALLEELGYEVYIPKLIPQTIEHRSAGVTCEFDRHLTIPGEVLESLNNFNFYTSELTPRIRRILNSYFSIMVVSAFPLMLGQAMEYFEGHIFLRAFGNIRDFRYSGLFESELGPGFPEAIARLGSRFHFGCGYKDIEKGEPEYLKTRTVFLPIGLPDRFFSQGDIWNGEIPKLLFICPTITIPYYNTIYHQFKKDFQGIPYLIGGWNDKIPDDPAVLGNMERPDFDRLLQNMRVMFYHSTEPRHLHYHPLEAMARGMPVVFMRESLLGQMDTTGSLQPGSCRNIAEAKNKIHRLLAGDKNLADDIRSAQKRMLVPFMHARCLAEWQKNFVPAVHHIPQKPVPRPFRIAVMLPMPYKTGTFDAAKAIAKMIHLGSRRTGYPAEVVFSCVADHYNINEEFDDLKDLGICIRETRWDLVNRSDAERMMRMEGRAVPLEYPQYTVPRDGMRDFLDADWWLIISDSVMCAPVPLRKYGVVIHDCLSRFFPEYQDASVDGRISIARTADFVIATTPQTRNEIISYHGIRPDKVLLFPHEFGMDPSDISSGPVDQKNYFIWSTNPSPHKNIINALDALHQYYSEGGELSVIITGSQVEQFDEELTKSEAVTRPLASEARKKIHSSEFLRKKVIIWGNLSKREYYMALKNARFVWHPALYDNGTFTVIEAAVLGTPSLSADYPQMRYINSTYELNLAFFDPRSPKKMCEALHQMEREWQHQKTLLPRPEHVLKRGWNSLAESYWKQLSEVL